MNRDVTLVVEATIDGTTVMLTFVAGLFASQFTSISVTHIHCNAMYQFISVSECPSKALLRILLKLLKQLCG